MEPKNLEFAFFTPKPNVSQNNGKQEELDSNKRKMILCDALDLSLGKSKKKSFTCKFCKKTFVKPQSLGGHQKAHKDECATATVKKSMTLGCYRSGPDNLYPNKGYFSNPGSYYQNPMIEARFSEPNLGPHGLGDDGWKGSSPNPNAISPVIPKENTEIWAEYGFGEKLGGGSSSSGAMLNLVMEGNHGVVINDKDGSQDEDESLDLTLKL